MDQNQLFRRANLGRTIFSAIFALGLLIGCEQLKDLLPASEKTAATAAPQSKAAPSADSTKEAQTDNSAKIPPPSAAASKATAPLLAGERISIPEGELLGGTAPGQWSRIPELEPVSYSAQLGNFEIDRFVYPNDPAQAPLLGLSQKDASARCAARGQRLCTELEWEYACRGPKNDTFAGGESLQPNCAEGGERCASGFDVLGLGSYREWTTSTWQNPATQFRGTVVRGRSSSGTADSRRCAHRELKAAGEASEKDDEADKVAFRCCSGAENGARLAKQESLSVFEKTRLPSSELEELLKAAPETKDLAKDIVYFREPQAAETVVSRGPGDRKGFLFTVSPLIWRPVPGAEFLLISARSGKDLSFVLAYYVIAPKKYQLAASYILEHEAGPIAFAYSESISPRLHFSNCWGCSGETGKILFRQPERIAIIQP